MMAGAQVKSNGDFSERYVDPPAGSYGGLKSSAEFMAAMRPPAFLVDGVMQRGLLYAITGATGHGKTAIALRLAACVAQGVPFCGQDVRQGSVLFLAGENPDNVRHQWFGLCADLGISPADLPVSWHPGHFGLERAAERLERDASRFHDLRLIVADTLQAFFEGDDDNSNPAMLGAARSFRTLTQLPSRPTVLVPAHPIKNARPDTLLPRGGSAFLNEIDGNLTVWLNQATGTVTLHWQGKHRGPAVEPLRLELVRTEPDGLVDEEGRQMPCTVARPLLTDRETQIASEAMNREDKALAAIQAQPNISVRALAEELSISKTSANRLMTRLRELRWIKKSGRGHVLTGEGEAVLET